MLYDKLVPYDSSLQYENPAIEDLAIGEDHYEVPDDYINRIASIQEAYASAETTAPKATLQHEQELAALIQMGLQTETRVRRPAEQATDASAVQSVPKPKNDRSNALQEGPLHESDYNLIANGRKVQAELVEAVLPLAVFLARASMGVVRESELEEWAAVLLPHANMTWMPARISDLHSQHAVLDDRIQEANLAIVRAARDFVPGITNQKGEPISFRRFVIPYVKNALVSHAKTSEQQMPTSYHHVEDSFKAHKDNWQEYFTPQQRDQILLYQGMETTVPLDELYFAGAADEELEDEAIDDGDCSFIPAHEVIASVLDTDPADEVARIACRQVLEEIFAEGIVVEIGIDGQAKTKPVFSPRELAILRMIFGLYDDVQYSKVEVAEHFGVSHQRIQQQQVKALDKLESPRRMRLMPVFYRDGPGGSPMRSVNVVKTSRRFGRTVVRLMTPSASVVAGQEQV